MSWYRNHRTRIAVLLMVVIALSTAVTGAIPGWVAGLWMVLAYVVWRMDKTRRVGAGDRVPHLAGRATAAVAAAMLAATGATGAAFADPAQHTTETFTGTFTFDAPVACDGGPTYTQTQDVTITDYFVTTSGQTLHDRSTLSVSFTGTPLDPTLPTVTGTTEGKANFNRSQIGAAEETFNGFTTATYSDGKTVKTHETLHFTVRHDGRLVTSFDRCV
jgi:hypothetical protein